MSYPANTAARFWSLVATGKPWECWRWQGGMNSQGYGVTRFGGRLWRSHRLAFTLDCGSIPQGMLVCHHCDQPACCNPGHLFLATQRENIRDAAWKGRLVHVNGERAGGAKLTTTEVGQIRAVYRRGSPDLGQVALGKRYGVRHTTIHRIVTGRTWARRRGSI